MVTTEGFPHLLLVADFQPHYAKLATTNRFATPEAQIGPTHLQQIGSRTPQTGARQEPQAPATPIRMADRQETAEDEIDGLKMFRGDGSEDEQLWKKKFHLLMVGKTPTSTQAQRDRLGAHLFEGYMRPGEPGEEWLFTLTDAQRGSWPAISALFDIQWPPEQRRVESYAEKWEAFENHNLDPADIGTRVEVSGRKRQAYDVYAEELYRLGRKCTPAPDISLITSAKKRLPESLRRLMRNKTLPATTWREWTTPSAASRQTT